MVSFLPFEQKNKIDTFERTEKSCSHDESESRKKGSKKKCKKRNLEHCYESNLLQVLQIASKTRKTKYGDVKSQNTEEKRDEKDDLSLNTFYEIFKNRRENNDDTEPFENDDTFFENIHKKPSISQNKLSDETYIANLKKKLALKTVIDAEHNKIVSYKTCKMLWLSQKWIYTMSQISYLYEIYKLHVSVSENNDFLLRRTKYFTESLDAVCSKTKEIRHLKRKKNHTRNHKNLADGDDKSNKNHDSFQKMISNYDFLIFRIFEQKTSARDDAIKNRVRDGRHRLSQSRYILNVYDVFSLFTTNKFFYKIKKYWLTNASRYDVYKSFLGSHLLFKFETNKDRIDTRPSNHTYIIEDLSNSSSCLEFESEKTTVNDTSIRTNSGIDHSSNRVKEFGRKPREKIKKFYEMFDRFFYEYVKKTPKELMAFEKSTDPISFEKNVSYQLRYAAASCAETMLKYLSLLAEYDEAYRKSKDHREDAVFVIMKEKNLKKHNTENIHSKNLILMDLAKKYEKIQRTDSHEKKHRVITMSKMLLYKTMHDAMVVCCKKKDKSQRIVFDDDDDDDDSEHVLNNDATSDSDFTFREFHETILSERINNFLNRNDFNPFYAEKKSTGYSNKKDTPRVSLKWYAKNDILEIKEVSNDENDDFKKTWMSIRSDRFDHITAHFTESATHKNAINHDVDILEHLKTDHLNKKVLKMIALANSSTHANDNGFASDDDDKQSTPTQYRKKQNVFLNTPLSEYDMLHYLGQTYFKRIFEHNPCLKHGGSVLFCDCASIITTVNNCKKYSKATYCRLSQPQEKDFSKIEGEFDFKNVVATLHYQKKIFEKAYFYVKRHCDTPGYMITHYDRRHIVNLAYERSKLSYIVYLIRIYDQLFDVFEPSLHSEYMERVRGIFENGDDDDDDKTTYYHRSCKETAHAFQKRMEKNLKKHPIYEKVMNTKYNASNFGEKTIFSDRNTRESKKIRLTTMIPDSCLPICTSKKPLPDMFDDIDTRNEILFENYQNDCIGNTENELRSDYRVPIMMYTSNDVSSYEESVENITSIDDKHFKKLIEMQIWIIESFRNRFGMTFTYDTNTEPGFETFFNICEELHSQMTIPRKKNHRAIQTINHLYNTLKQMFELCVSEKLESDIKKETSLKSKRGKTSYEKAFSTKYNIVFSNISKSKTNHDTLKKLRRYKKIIHYSAKRVIDTAIPFCKGKSLYERCIVSIVYMLVDHFVYVNHDSNKFQENRSHLIVRYRKKDFDYTEKSDIGNERFHALALKFGILSKENLTHVKICPKQSDNATTDTEINSNYLFDNLMIKMNAILVFRISLINFIISSDRTKTKLQQTENDPVCFRKDLVRVTNFEKPFRNKPELQANVETTPLIADEPIHKEPKKNVNVSSEISQIDREICRLSDELSKQRIREKMMEQFPNRKDSDHIVIEFGEQNNHHRKDLKRKRMTSFFRSDYEKYDECDQKIEPQNGSKEFRTLVDEPIKKLKITSNTYYKKYQNTTNKLNNDAKKNLNTMFDNYKEPATTDYETDYDDHSFKLCANLFFRRYVNEDDVFLKASIRKKYEKKYATENVFLENDSFLKKEKEEEEEEEKEKEIRLYASFKTKFQQYLSIVKKSQTLAKNDNMLRFLNDVNVDLLYLSLNLDTDVTDSQNIKEDAIAKFEKNVFKPNHMTAFFKHLDATNDLFKISKENFNVISLFEYMVQR